MRPSPLFCALLAASTLTFASAAAFACSCAPPPPAPVALEASGHVFEAKVTAGPTAPQPGPEGAMSSFAPVSYSMEVLRSWKGGLKGEVSLFTAGNGAACGRSFDVGTTYLVYASVDDKGQVRDSLCSRTRSGAAAREDIAVLGEPGATTPTEQQPAETEQGDAASGTEATPAAGDEPTPAATADPTPTPDTAPVEDEPETKTGKDPADPSCSVGARPTTPTWLALALLAALPLLRRRR